MDYTNDRHMKIEGKEKKRRNEENLVLEKSWRRPVLEKMMRATSASQRMASSFAFLMSPFRRFEKVTCLLVLLSIRRITIFPLPISPSLFLSSLQYLVIYPSIRSSNYFGGEVNEQLISAPTCTYKCTIRETPQVKRIIKEEEMVHARTSI